MMGRETEESLKKEDLCLILDRNEQWINSCDTKASILVSGIIAIAGIGLAFDYVSVVAEIVNAMNKKENFWSILYLVLLVLSCVSVVAGLGCLVAVLRAKVKPEEYRSRGLITDSLLFFGTIAKNTTVKKYSIKLNECNEKGLRDEIISQIYICSLICQRKYVYFNRGMLFGVIGVAAFASLFVIGAAIAST